MTMQSNRMLLGLTLAASMFAGALATSGPAAAQANDDGAGLKVTVRYSDLDLSREAGARIVYQRIKSAATEACGGQPDIRLLTSRMIYIHCRAETIDRAVKTLNAPLVTAMAHGAATTVYAGR